MCVMPLHRTHSPLSFKKHSTSPKQRIITYCTAFVIIVFIIMMFDFDFLFQPTPPSLSTLSSNHHHARDSGVSAQHVRTEYDHWE